MSNGDEVLQSIEFGESTSEMNTPEEAQATPLSISNFKPLEENIIICQISPAKFDSLLKVLKVLVTDKSSNDSLVIKESTITQSIPGTVISADISDIFGDKKINLQIINPKKYIRLFSNFRNNNDIFVLDDNDNSRFIFTNGEIKLFLPKQIEKLVEDVKLPDLSAAEQLCSIKVDKLTKKIISSLASDVQYVDYLIQDNLLKGIHIPDTAIYLFNEYIKDSKAAKLDETNADLALRSTSYLLVESEDYEIFIGRLKDSSLNTTYVSATICNTGFVKVDVYENLDTVTGGNILI